MVHFTTDKEKARDLVRKGALGVELSFGDETIANDPSQPFDHHNTFSHLPCASVQALKSSKRAKSVVVNHVDLDCVMASAILLGRVSRGNTWIKAAVPLIQVTDTGGLHALTQAQKKDPAYQLLVHFYKKTGRMAPSESSFNEALRLVESFEKGPTDETQESMKSEEDRLEVARKGVVEQRGDVLLAHSEAWGFDVWYKQAPVVVAYVGSKKSVSIGVVTTEKAEELFGPGGLKNVFPKLGSGWGGRESIGGSPRDQAMTLDDAKGVFDKVIGMIKKKQASKGNAMRHVTAQLDRIANKLQAECPSAALALDMISDRLEKRASDVNAYLTDFFGLVEQLPTRDGEVLRQLAGRWPMVKGLLKGLNAQALKDDAVDGEYVRAVFEDFKKAAVLLDKVENFYNKVVREMNFEGIKTHSESLIKLIQRMGGLEEQTAEELVEESTEAEERGI